MTGAPVLVLKDECAHRGRMAPVERDIGLVSGYSVTFRLLVQNLAQLTWSYLERWPTFLANCDVLQLKTGRPPTTCCG